MSIAQLQDYVFTTKYARWRADLGRRETYAEAVERVFAMHARRYAAFPVQEELAFAKQAVLERLVLGSQRALQFGGEPIEQKHARLYNCTVSYCDRPRFFQETLWLLLCGCGVGFSVQRHHVARLPAIVAPTGQPVSFTIADSIEGWADGLGALIDSYAGSSRNPIRFDYSHIRPEGAPLRGGSGTAPGPAPLRSALERIRAVIDRRIACGESRLRTIDCYDIVMHASDAVLSGGVRRSATICLFSPDDEELAAAKTGDWFVTNPQRGRSNNSALLVRSTTTKKRFLELMRHVREFGEPGFMWADSAEIVYNPCGEIGMYPVDETTGASGWSFCNLCEINCKACATPELLKRAARAGAILGTIQAGYTDFPYLGAVSERIVRREALLGVSMTGMMDNPTLAFDPALQRELAGIVLTVNAQVAGKIAIAPAARATCVKPAGTTSAILGTASGIHAHHARRYFRRVQANVHETPFTFFRLHNPRAVERSVWNPNGSDGVITFCVDVPEEARTRNEMPAVELLRHVELTQANWVAAGRRADRCVQPWLSHNVSNTITVRPEEWDAVADLLYEHRQAFAGVSLLPWGGDLDYPQAPFCAVWTAEEIVKHHGVGALMASGLIVDGIRAFDHDRGGSGGDAAQPQESPREQQSQRIGDAPSFFCGSDALWAGCACVLGTGEALVMPERGDETLEAFRLRVERFLSRQDWVRRARKFAHNYFADDLRSMTYCLKRVHNAKLWEDLRREYKPVDWTALRETRDQTGRVELDPACVGGACEFPGDRP